MGNSADCTWQVPNQEKRERDVNKLGTFQKSLVKNLNPNSTTTRS